MSREPALDEHAPDDRPARWGLPEAVAGYLAAFVLASLAGAVWIGVSGDDDLSMGLVVATLLGQWTGLVGAAVLASRYKGSGSLVRDFGLRVEARDVLPGLAWGLGSQFILVYLLYLPFRLLDSDLDVSEEARRLVGTGRGGGLALLAVFLVLGAPVVEELFFRGLLQRALRRRMASGAAIAISSLAFGVTHYQPLQLLGLVAFGVVLGFLAERAGRLGPNVVAHAAFNGSTVVLLTLAR